MGWQLAVAMAETVADDSEDSKQKPQRRFSVGERRIAPGETLDWLPAGWIVEDRVRSSGATAGMIDKYYCDPTSGHVFRSKKEVLYFLENGTKRKKNADNSEADMATGESPGSSKQKAGAAVKTPSHFDFNDPPESFTWVLIDSSWLPFMDGKKVPDPMTREWAAAFKFVSTEKP